jgi:predicted nucleotidyltransferase
LVSFLKEEFRKQGLKLNGIALFGSQLKGTANKESDIDL